MSFRPDYNYGGASVPSEAEKTRNNLDAAREAIEAANRSPAMQRVLQAALKAEFDREVVPANKIRIVTDFPSSTAPIAVYPRPDSGIPEAAPFDAIVVSFYEYKDTPGNEAARRANNPGLRSGVTMSGALQLVDEVTEPSTQISRVQLTAIQNLMGNNSTWWPIKDYNDEDFNSVFNPLELRLIYKDGIPVGIAHLDKAGMDKENPAERSAKIVFVALDPALHGKGIGRECVHEMMTIAINGGAAIVNLDTVCHRDCASDSKTDKLTTRSAGSVYEKAGFELVAASLINPGDKAQLDAAGLKINQLNGPIPYVHTRLEELRTEVAVAFGIEPSKYLATIEEFRNEPHIEAPKPAPTPHLIESVTSTPLAKELGVDAKAPEAAVRAV